MYVIKVDNLYFRSFEYDEDGNITGVYLTIDYNNAKPIISQLEANKIKTTINILYDNVEIKELVIKE